MFICRNYKILNIHKKEQKLLKGLPFSIKEFYSSNFLNEKIKFIFFKGIQKFFKIFEKIFLFIYLHKN